MLRRSKWYLLLIALAALMAFSVFGIPRIAVHMLERTRGQIVTMENDTN